MRRLNRRKPDPDQKIEANAKMDSINLQLRPNPPHRSNLFARNPKHFSDINKSKVVISALIAVTLCLFCYVLVTGFRSSIKRRFGIVIDGGSTGTRIHVFEYGVRGGTLDFDFGRHGLASLRVNPGLSAYTDDPEMAGGSLKELIEFAKKKVPKECWGETEIRLMATAGLRMVNLGVQDSILESCRRVLRSSGFKFRDDWASVISGSDEGIYAWVVANYALGTLGGDPLKTTGIIELGGASAQVTFVSREPIPSEFCHIVKFGNISYSLYSHNLLQYGQNVAHDLVRESLISGPQGSTTKSIEKEISIDPCTPIGYSHSHVINSWTLSPGSMAEKSKHGSALQPQGNYSECRSAALALLQKGKEKCSYQHCYIGSTFIPKLQGKFLATENFFHTAKFFGIPPRASLSDFVRAGQQFCEEEWPKLRVKYHSYEEDDLLRYCFSSAYIVGLLHDSLGIPLEDDGIGFTNKVGDTPLDWALGAFILQRAADLNAEHPNWIESSTTSDSYTLIVLFVIFIVLLFVWSLSKWRKPQLKTIYDLEKGKYIVTRISRHP